ncbi:MAG: formylmethanofuran dehydrogenase subunit C [Candidatus Bathyarchaeia archaeon]
MKILKLKYFGETLIPIEAENITPDLITGKQLSEIERLTLYTGNREHKLSEFFDISGDVSNEVGSQMILVEGETSLVKYIGSSMSSGKIIIEGNTGMHLGSKMTGGEIQVKGSVDDWAGAEMSGGYIRVNGNAGNRLGSGYRGSSEGMTGGVIVVDGNVGQECGALLRRGMIVIRGAVAPFAGVHMNGGQIFAFGKVSKRLGASAKGNGGFIACLGGVEQMLPTYKYDSTYKPNFMRVYLQQLSENFGVKEAEKFMDTSFERYSGDLACGGNNEIFIASAE